MDYSTFAAKQPSSQERETVRTDFVQACIDYKFRTQVSLEKAVAIMRIARDGLTSS